MESGPRRINRRASGWTVACAASSQSTRIFARREMLPSRHVTDER
jgi:hypothetical protein